MIHYWILKVENIEIKGKNALVFMAAQLQQPWLVPSGGLSGYARYSVNTLG